MENQSHFEKILNNPGLHHLAENIFENLNNDDLVVCLRINQSSKKLIEYQKEKPMLLLKKFRHLSRKNQKNWTKEIQSMNKCAKLKAIVSYLNWKLKEDGLIDLPCYTKPAVQDEFKKKMIEICDKVEVSHEDMNIVKILAQLTENPNVPDEDG